MADVLWFMTRATGIVAMVLILAALADGLIYSGREGGRRLRPAWWLDLHRGLGGYALAFTGLHLVSAFGADIGAGLAQIFLPQTSPTSTMGFTLGVLALYGLVITVFTSWPSQLFKRRAWHVLHLLSIPTALAAAVHAWQLGTDAMTPWFMGVGVVVVAVAMYPVGLRISGIARRRDERHHGGAPSSLAPQVPTAPPSPGASDDAGPVLVGARETHAYPSSPPLMEEASR